MTIHHKRRKALIIISSARILPLAEPKSHIGLSTGFFLIELARVLQTFADTHEFVFATPDGMAPQLDINGLSLSLHAMDKMGAEMGSTMVDQLFNFNADNFRKKRTKLVARRDGELSTAYKYLGKIPISDLLPNTDKEVKVLYPELLKSMGKLLENKFFSINQLLEKDRDPENTLKLKDFDFVHLPGGHGPMVDFYENPYLGELLNILRENGALISLICHAPVALTSTKYRVSVNGKISTTDNHNFKGAKITVSSKLAEMIAVRMAYPKIPGRKTRLEFIVEDALRNGDYQVETKFNPLAIQVVYDPKFKLLTGNGPQAMDAQAKKLQEILSEAR
ncbi:hypothetical protein SRABI27_03112 [Pedobacter sp. Bi27]|uniref:hypothetical protein n=1 Tax=Pedobacter sp. Bi27 TaxID=2822351 RepID=UPI001D6574B7|nr:hypothetical protein [Pedobacter sp. Bi27]CAH0256847.1 hypothetical protein SRABI27_03112 [Pedobacter sp. Bi27]